jgi:hypothetical protein
VTGRLRDMPNVVPMPSGATLLSPFQDDPGAIQRHHRAEDPEGDRRMFAQPI